MDNLTQNAEPQTSSTKPKRGCLKPLLLTVAAFLLALHFITPSIIRHIANGQLPALLGTDASVGSISLNLLTGNASVRKVTLAQPPGVDASSPLLTLGELSLSAAPVSAIRQNPVLLRHLRVSDLSLHLIADTNGVLNATRLVPPPSPPAEEIAPSEPDAAPPAVPAVWIQQILLANVDLVFRDLAKQWQISIEDLTFEVSNLHIAGDAPDSTATIRAELHIRSPASRASAPLLLLGRLGRIQPDNPDAAPPLRLALGLFGFDLAAIDPFLAPAPAAAKAALGGGGVDFVLFVDLGRGDSLAEQAVTGRYSLTTDAGRGYRGTLGGTAARPDMPFLKIFSNLLGTQLGRVTDLGGNVARGAFSAVEGAADTGVTAVKGAANAVKGLGTGLFRTAKGVVTLDSEEALGGMKDATLGTATQLVDTVAETAGSAVGAVSETFDTVRGADDVRKWWEDVALRRAAFEAEATQWLSGF